MNKRSGKKVLIITYYWPPTGGSGVQRWVKFTKYLREFGWEPVIYTPSNPEAPALDESLLKDIPDDIEVMKRPIWEPYTFYKKFVGLKKEEKLGAALMTSGNENSFLKDLSVWIRGNFFIPDARKFWIRPSVKYLTQLINEKPVDAVVSTGPPHSMHMIGMRVSQKTNTPWLADFRDPWTNIDFFEDLKLSSFARKRHHTLEKKVLDRAGKILVVSNTMKKEFTEITDTDISVIPNGFDTEDFPENKYSPNDYCTVSHIGMMTPTRNPQILWKALKELWDEVDGFKDNFRLHLIGKVDESIRLDINQSGIEPMVVFKDYIPHKEIIPVQQNSEALLLIINNSPNAALLLTGKLFEYLAAKRPIICITPVKGDAADVLEESPASTTILYSEKQKLKDHLKHIYNSWESGTDLYKGSRANKYSRRALTENLVSELNSIT